MKEKQKKIKTATKGKVKKKSPSSKAYPLWWKLLIPVLLLTGILFSPALKNGFTNWDDILYVTHNELLKDLSPTGLKAIFSTPIVSNYHPLTILSLALNYQMAELEPWTYHFTSILLHVVNTGLVFWFIWTLSSGNTWVSAIVALLFGIHPMHVESVAWISERKDLLYTLFYLVAMTLHVKYVRNPNFKYLVAIILCGALSLLSKPAAIVLPLSLLVIDFYLKRRWSWKWVTEKIPLFILSGIMAYVTLDIQSQKAVASVELHGILDRICFAGFGGIWYLLKIVAPYPLSALHPFPKALNVFYYLAPVVMLAGIVLLALKVRNRTVLFGFGFYLVNLLLVLQLISIGNAVVAERYTYVPYIGIFFMLTMEAYKALQGKWAKYKWIAAGIGGAFMIGLAVITWMHIPVWKNSQALWENVLKHYPTSARAWTNKGLDYYDQKKWPEVIDHLTKALEDDPNHDDALEWRTRAYLENRQGDLAFEDAIKFHTLYPDKEASLLLLARCQDVKGQFEAALSSYSQLIERYPQKPEYINNRGVLYFNRLKLYPEAKADFEKAIQLNPANGSYYLNLSRCYYMGGEIEGARKIAMQAKELGTVIDNSYANLIGLE